MTSRSKCFSFVALAAVFAASLSGCQELGNSYASAPKPLRVLLITGGCCHDYARQKDILKQGIEARANVVVDQIHTDDKTTHPPLAILGNPDYAKGYDLVIHDECGADISDPAVVQGVLKPHQDGIPGVNLHCAMHCYRIGNPNDPVTLGTPHGYWFEYLGLQSSGHGAQLPISLAFADPESPVTKGMANWTTINEELYNNIHLFANAHALARGSQVVKRRNGEQGTNTFVTVWSNTYGPKKTRVFSTTIGHNNDTVSDPRYLDLVTRGVLWATGHLKNDGAPEKGYGPGGK
ncbi:MAG TPA: ThuA domain-containing protein [Verrucomicrobiae bacterium]|nr:ThuA domain-containing protein [Verrucomicrobiae bacterium]